MYLRVVSSPDKKELKSISGISKLSDDTALLTASGRIFCSSEYTILGMLSIVQRGTAKARSR